MDEATKMEMARIRDEDSRQNRRLDLLEQNTTVVQSIALSVERLAVNMEQMLREQETQGDRLDKLERAPAEQWSSMTRTVFNNLTGALTTAVAGGIIWAIAQYIK